MYDGQVGMVTHDCEMVLNNHIIYPLRKSALDLLREYVRAPDTLVLH